jgi:PAS domain-containing protein
MTFEEYRSAYYRDEPLQYAFSRGFSAALYVSEYPRAVEFYSAALGQPQYVEGEHTRGWSIGGSWLTLFPADALTDTAAADGTAAISNCELQFHLDSPDEARRLRRAFMEAGAQTPEPTEELMYVPVLFCPVRDPFGNQLLITAELEGGKAGEEREVGSEVVANVAVSELTAILDGIPDPVVYVDTGHTVRFVNRAGREKEAWNREGSLLGRSIFHCHNDASREMMMDMFRRLQNGERDICFSDKPGTRTYMTGVYDATGKLTGYWERYEYGA